MKRFLVLFALTMMIAATTSSIAADGVTDLRVSPSATTVINSPGSYRLVSDVTMTANVIAITINAENVTLDLNGHLIKGHTGNQADGIHSYGASTVVFNGTVVGFGGSGIILEEDGGVIRKIRAFGNGFQGLGSTLSVGAESVVEDCVVSNNNTTVEYTVGIETNERCRVIRNVVSNNVSTGGQSMGIITQNKSVITDNVVSGNSGVSSAICAGIYADDDCVIRGNVVSNNDNTGTGNAIGIYTTTDCVIEGNTCTDQSTATTGTGSAIGIMTTGSLVAGNTCGSNSASLGSNGFGSGIQAGNNSVVRGNLCKGNVGRGTGTSNGIIAGASCRIEGNHCQGNSGASASHGIRVTSTANLVAGNSTVGHSNGGIIFLNATSNRCHSNQCRESEAIESTLPGVPPDSIGMGDLENLFY